MGVADLGEYISAGISANYLGGEPGDAEAGLGGDGVRRRHAHLRAKPPSKSPNKSPRASPREQADCRRLSRRIAHPAPLEPPLQIPQVVHVEPREQVAFVDDEYGRSAADDLAEGRHARACRIGARVDI